MRKLALFIIGTPRAGSTSLSSYLAGHPLVYFSPIKEARFFNDDPDLVRVSATEYEKLFARATRGSI
jgi:hypothetical protein